MKTAIAIMMALGLTAVVGCQSDSSKGGGMASEDGFRISVPSSETKVKQGELETVSVKVNRDDHFKQAVKLEVKSDKNITVEPASVVVKASDKPDVQLRISARKDAALGEYRVSVKGTPETGEPTSTDFNVRVVAP